MQKSRSVQQQMSRHNSRVGFEISQELRLDNQQLGLKMQNRKKERKTPKLLIGDLKRKQQQQENKNSSIESFFPNSLEKGLQRLDKRVSE